MKLAALILIVSIGLSVLLAVATRGQVIFVGLPLVFGLPLAGILNRWPKPRNNRE